MRNNIKHYRVKAGLTQVELARRLGYVPDSVRLWEHGRVQPPLEMLVRLADTLGCEATDLYPEIGSKDCGLNNLELMIKQDLDALKRLSSLAGMDAENIRARLLNVLRCIKVVQSYLSEGKK